MREIVILSGKGGTGKTSLSAALAHLADQPIICDLDVDAPDLHLVLTPNQIMSEEFISGHQAVIVPEKCEQCGVCIDACRFNAIHSFDDVLVVDPVKCEGCKLCVALCPADAIAFPDKHCGNWYVSDTRFGPMVHAQLFPAEENSGRLVALLRAKAKEIAKEKGYQLILSDGPPGIGCPVISSLSGNQLAVIITEPSPSGYHDLVRVVELCEHFKVPAGIVINKHDLDLDYDLRIERQCRDNGVMLLGRIPYDPVFVQAMLEQKTVTEFSDQATAKAIHRIWLNILSLVNE